MIFDQSLIINDNDADSSDSICDSNSGANLFVVDTTYKNNILGLIPVADK